MLRRPPVEGRLVAEPRKTKVLLVLAVIFLAWFPIADAQQHHQQQSVGHQQLPIADSSSVSGPNKYEHINNHNEDDEKLVGDRAEPRSPFESSQSIGKFASASSHPSPSRDPESSHHHALTTAYTNEHTIGQERPNDHLYPDPHDASALATLAPDYPVRAAKSPRQLSSILTGAGLSSPQSARSLESWEVEDYVLLATVDGHLRAVSKESGEERWHLVAEEPAVETIHHRPNMSIINDHDRLPHDDYVWAIEPSHTGPVFVWMSSALGSGLTSAGFTMKQLVDDYSPYAVQDPPVVYTGDKKTTMYILNAAKGQVLRWYGQGEGQVAPVATCFQPKGIVDPELEECAGTIALSRTEYTVNIHHQDDGRLIATLRYREWGPNAYDNDLHKQYSSTRDNRYLTSRHDGRLYALDDSADMQSISVSFPAPVARVFDVARPQDVPRGGNPELVLLPQPAPPFPDGELARARGSSIYLNKTEAGSWYALSGTLYPLVVDAPPAKVNLRDRVALEDYEDPIPDDILIGTHFLGGHMGDNYAYGTSQRSSLPALPGAERQIHVTRNTSSVTASDEEDDTQSLVETVKSFPHYVLSSVVQLLRNPVFFLIIASAVATWYKTRWPHSTWREKLHLKRNSSVIKSLPPTDIVSPIGPADLVALPETVVTAPELEQLGDVGMTVIPNLPIPDLKHTTANVLGEEDIASQTQDAPSEPRPAVDSPEKKKAHRGRRGGVKHKKRNREASTAPESKTIEVDPVAQVDQMVEAQEPQLNPNIKSIGKADDISIGGFEINGLEVDLNEQLGMGSNGTVVFPGTFHGREIAVKRMLHEFNDLATRETKLLLESDNHPNGKLLFKARRIEPKLTYWYSHSILCDSSGQDFPVYCPGTVPGVACGHY